MMFGKALWAAAVQLAAVAWLAAPALAQQANVGVGYSSLGHSYYESIGVQWGLRGNGWFFNFGGPPLAPPFGGFDPGSGASFGFSGPRGFFNVTAAQGSSRSLVGSAPSVTVMNGGTGFFSDTLQRPFVTGFVPVVGAGGPGPTMLDERLSRLQAGETPPPRPNAAATAASTPQSPVSSAERGDLSIAEIKARKAVERAATSAAAQAEIADLLEKARTAEAAGKANVARLFLQMASRKADGEQQAAIAAEIQRLEAESR